jgi:hypothetical protein
MALLGQEFNISQVDTTQKNELLPPDRYTVAVTGTDVKESKKDSRNKYVWVELSIISDRCKGRKLFQMYNLWNSNPQAVVIAEAEFARLCKSCGKFKTISDTNELMGQIFDIDVDVDKKTGTNNIIKKYYSADDKKAEGEVHRAVATPAGNSATAPWARG